jgi:hypothetical protein
MEALFVYDEVLSDNQILPETDFHAYCRKWALEREGSVVTWQQDRIPAIIYDDDVVVYTKGTDSSPIELLQELNPTREFDVMESGELLNAFRN